MPIVDVRGKLPTHKSKVYKRRKLTDIRSLGLHHSLTFSGSAKAFADYHVHTNDWPGIGYAYVIDRDGTIYWCWDWTVVSYHVGNSNKHSLGVCMVGDFRTQLPTVEQYAAAIWLFRYLQQEIPTGESILGHSEYPGYSWKSCPVINMDRFRNDVAGAGKEDDTLEITEYQWKQLSSSLKTLVDRGILSDKNWIKKADERKLTVSELTTLNTIILARTSK